MGRGGIAKKPALSPTDAWISSFDHDAFKHEIRALGKELLDAQGPADLAHLQRICLASNLFCVVGLSTMWIDSFWWGILSVICLSTVRLPFARPHACPARSPCPCAAPPPPPLTASPTALGNPAAALSPAARAAAVDFLALDHDWAPRLPRRLRQGR